MATKRSDQLRTGRHFTPHHYFHITLVTHRRQPFFVNTAIARTVIELLRYQHNVGNVQSFVFMIMPDHVHWLIKSIDGRYDRSIQQIKSRASRTAQTTLWQRNYFDKEIRDERQLHQAIHYILRNPLEDQLANRIKDYAHWGVHPDWIPDWVMADGWFREWGELRVSAHGG